VSDRKVIIRNIALFTNAKPTDGFDFVNILDLGELLSYVKFFSPMYTAKETEEMASYLLSVSESREVACKLRM
jgi:hypothetical protein